MSWRFTLGALGALIAVGILIVGAGLAFLHLPALEPARHQVAASLLSSYLGEAVVVDGDVSMTFGRTIDISASGVSPEAIPQGLPVPVGTVRLSFATDAALRGRLLLTRLDVAKIRMIIDAASDRRPAGALGERIAERVEAFLSSPLIRSLEIEELEFQRINDPSGWNDSLVLDRASSRAMEGGGTISIDVEGSLNGEAFTIVGQLPDLSEPGETVADDEVSLHLAVEGLEVDLAGRLLRADGGLRLDGNLDARSASLGDLQEVLELARAVEGVGTLTLALRGALSRLEVESGRLQLEMDDGLAVEVQGAVADVWSLGGVDLGFSAMQGVAGATTARSGLDLSIRTISGRLSGTAPGFEIDDVVTETDVAVVELQQIGPVRIGRIARDENGRLQLDDIRVVQGDPKDPALDLSGRLGDVLNLSDFSMQGSFRFAMAGLLMEGDATPVLGDLRGTVLVSDASGQLQMDALEARLAGTDLMSLSLALADTRRPGGAVQLRFEVPDLTRLSTAVGGEASAAVGVMFDGTIDAVGDALTLQGSARIGKTEVDGRLRIAAPSGAPEIVGTIHSPGLYIGDLIAARDLTRVFPGPGIDGVTLRKDLVGKTTLSVEIAADAIESQRRGHGGLTARLSFGDARLRIEPFELAYLGGRAAGAVRVQVGAASPSFVADVQIRTLSLAQLFDRFGKAEIASGSLDLDLAVSGQGADPAPLLASLSGQISGSIRDGSLADQTVNLAGQNIIAWIFTRSADGSAPLECLEARFDFKRGVGTAEKLVFETDKVQVVGGGTLDLRSATMDLLFTPRPKRDALTGEVGAVALSGPLSSPQAKLADGAIAAKVIGDTIGLPLRALGTLIGAGGRAAGQHRPCVVVPESTAPERATPRREPAESPFLSPQ